MISPSPIHLFGGFGVELEYAIVDSKTLDVRPIADELLRAAGAEDLSGVEVGPVAWSNELVLHVIEFKTNGPAPTLSGLSDLFHRQVAQANALLEPMRARLMPAGMHPWMDPDRDTHLWPHGNDIIYQTYDRIFNCRGHGWSNLQSAHLNLPFADDAEFERLHAAIRLILPIMPGIAASSPFVGGVRSGRLDTRLDMYRHNADRILSIAGSIIPEQIFSRSLYEERVLRRIYDDIAPHDPDGILREEWLNSRGCIAHFSRNTIEIRLLDLQESPMADLAVIGMVTAVVRALVEGKLGDLDRQKSFHEGRLSDLFLEGICLAENARIHDRDYLEVMGYQEGTETTSGDLWRHLVQAVPESVDPEWAEAVDVILRDGSLATRISDAAGRSPDRTRLCEVYTGLCDALDNNRMFIP